jgi:hypothetical protein
MKIMIEMSPEHYDLLLSRVSRYSVGFVLLKNSVVSGGSAKENRIVEIACEDSEAQSLLRIAQKVCPEAAIEIEKGVSLARPFQK